MSRNKIGAGHYYDSSKIGTVQRSYYQWDAKLMDLPSWSNRGELDPQPNKNTRKFVGEFLDSKELSGSKDVQNLKKASEYELLMNMLVEVLEDAFYAASDFLSWRKVKTSLTVLGGIGGGAAIGALLGTFVLPGVGTAIGGTAGAAITSGLGMIGGVVGTSIIGAFAGSWIGQKISDKLFKYEKRFQLSKKVTRKVNKELDVDNDTIDDMNFYLYCLGSKKVVGNQNNDLRTGYKKLRREALKKANPVAIQKLGDFFVKELDLLMEEELKRKNTKNHISPDAFEQEDAFKQEVDMVLDILKALQFSRLPDDSKDRIASVLEKYDKQHGNVDHDKPAPKQAKEQAKKQKKSVGMSKETQAKPVIFDRGTAPRSIPKPKTEYLGQVSATASDEQLAADIIEMVQPLYAQHQERPVKSARISSGGKEELAIQLCAALLIMGIEPLLKESEFPNGTPEAQKLRANIMQEAQKLKDEEFLGKEPFKNSWLTRSALLKTQT